MLLSAGSLAALLFLKHNLTCQNYHLIFNVAPHLPADLAHAASDVRVHHDDQERHEDEVRIA